MSLQPYPKEEFSSNIKYCLDGPETRRVLTEKLGESILGKMPYGTYIEIDTEKREWNPSPDFAWLYRNQPPLFDLHEL